VSLPAWQDSPSTAFPLSSANLLLYNTAINGLSSSVAALSTTLATLAPPMVVTAVQTSNYTASVNQYVLVSTTSGSVTVTFPTAPANFTVIGAKQVIRGGTNTVTIQLGGSDTFDTPGGSQTSTLTLLNQAGTWQYNSATAIWVRVSDDLPLSQLDARYVASVAAGDSTIRIGGTTTAPTVKVAPAALTIAQSQVTGLATTLAPGYTAGGQWVDNVYGNQFENMERDDTITTPGVITTTNKTLLILLGLVPASTYSAFKVYVSVASAGAGVTTCALYSSSSLTGTSWSRLGSGNVALSATTAGLQSTSLAFTLASAAYVALEMVATTAYTTYPTFLSGPAFVSAAFLNPASGCPVTGTTTGTTAPASTLNPTTGFTAGTQKVWCALA
jgi:hypothetical protein